MNQLVCWWLQLFSTIVAGFACSMQGTVYGFPTRALPQLVVEEDIYMRLSALQASWYGKLSINLKICTKIRSWIQSKTTFSLSVSNPSYNVVYTDSEVAQI